MECQAVWDRIVDREEVADDAISSFTCGDDRMDNWFQRLSLEASRKRMAHVYVAMLDDSVVGFYTLSNHVVVPENLSRSQKSGKNSMNHPCTLLGRIAVDIKWRRSVEHVGTALLYHAFRSAQQGAMYVASRFVILDPKEGLSTWYGNRGFIQLKNGQMVISFKKIDDKVRQLGDGFFRF